MGWCVVLTVVARRQSLTLSLREVNLSHKDTTLICVMILFILLTYSFFIFEIFTFFIGPKQLLIFILIQYKVTKCLQIVFAHIKKTQKRTFPPYLCRTKACLPESDSCPYEMTFNDNMVKCCSLVLTGCCIKEGQPFAVGTANHLCLGDQLHLVFCALDVTSDMSKMLLVGSLQQQTQMLDLCYV